MSSKGKISTSSAVWHEPATASYRESWATVNPRGTVIYFASEAEARDTLALWAAAQR